MGVSRIVKLDPAIHLPSAKSLLQAGGSYAAAAEQLAGTDHNAAYNGPFSPAIYMLIGFAVELMLKGMLLEAGTAQKVLRNIGHDLRKAVTALQERGILLDDGIADLSIAMADVHRQHAFRYLPEVEGLLVPDLSDCIIILGRLLRQGRAMIGF